MGRGIAQTAAQQGFTTLLYDLDAGMLEKAGAAIDQQLQKLADKGKIPPGEMETIQARLRYTPHPGDCVADLIIEAIVEKIEAKASLFNQLAEINGERSIFATNTSSLSVSLIAEKTTRPRQVVGMHFFNPAPVMKLVEIVRGRQTDEEVVKAVITLAKQMGKTPVLCKDAPGFIVNHVARHYYLEPLRLAESAGVDFQTIDNLLEASGFKMGPFKLMDLIGNDVNYAVSCSVYEALGKPDRLAPSVLQKEKVEQGALGLKTKKGYYNYE